MKTLKTAVALAVLLFSVYPASAAGSAQEPGGAKIRAKKAPHSALKTRRAVKETLDNLVNAFVGKDAAKFRSFVVEDFTGDAMILDSSIREAFRTFVDMDIRYTLDNITANSRNKKVSASVTFTRCYTDVKTTRRIKKTGSSQLIFKMVEGCPKLYSVQGPSMFDLDRNGF